MENINIYDVSGRLSKRIKSSVSPFHTVEYAFNELKSAGFKELDLEKRWEIEKGGRYVVKVFGSTLAAFTIGKKWDGMNFRFAAAHTDFPCVKLKPAAQIKENNYVKCNVDIYGGAILNTWLDRPLSAAGRVVLKSSDVMNPDIRLVNIGKPAFIIPNLAIHMNREVNKGVELNKQKDMLPVMCTIDNMMCAENMETQNGIAGCGYIDNRETDRNNEEKDYILSMISLELGVEENDILDYDMFLYPVEEPMLLGADNSIYSAGRLDNLTSVQACINGILSGMRNDGINMMVIYDSEEVGSATKQGAGSQITRSIIERIYDKSGFDKEIFECGMASALGLSIDVAHAVHPNAPEKSDITNKLYMNKGFAVKTAASERYASDIKVLGVLLQICEREKIPCRRYVNRSDMAGGSTLGAIAVSNLPIRMLDIGVPVLAMHSARETMGIYDQCCLEKAVESFFA